MNDIEGRRNRVFEDDKDIDEYSGNIFNVCQYCPVTVT